MNFIIKRRKYCKVLLLSYKLTNPLKMHIRSNNFFLSVCGFESNNTSQILKKKLYQRTSERKIWNYGCGLWVPASNKNRKWYRGTNISLVSIYNFHGLIWIHNNFMHWLHVFTKNTWHVHALWSKKILEVLICGIKYDCHWYPTLGLHYYFFCYSCNEHF